MDIIAQKEGADPAAVVFDAVTAAKARNVDVLVIMNPVLPSLPAHQTTHPQMHPGQISANLPYVLQHQYILPEQKVCRCV